MLVNTQVYTLQALTSALCLAQVGGTEPHHLINTLIENELVNKASRERFAATARQYIIYKQEAKTPAESCC